VDTVATSFITVLIPAYNEQETIAPVVQSVSKAMQGQGYQYEILVVDDCSTDDTASVAGSAGARVVRHSVNRGSGAARRTGIKEGRGDIIVMLDADGTYDPSSIPEMLKHFPDFDQVNGARTSEQGDLKWLRMLAKTLIRWFAMFLSGKNIPDLNTGLKAFKKPLMMNYLWVLPDGFSCVSTMTLAFLINGHAVKFVPTTYFPRQGGKSKFHPIKDTFKYIHTVVRMATFFRPLRAYGFLSFILLATGVVKSAYDYFWHAKHSLEESDIILICTGVLVGAIGLLADLIVAQRRIP
jgi:polyisoprenyl-phosphate glycosyltransferase